MSKAPNIQWADGTANPVMGCDGCELWPTTKFQGILRIADEVGKTPGLSRIEMKAVIERFAHGLPGSSALWHSRHSLIKGIMADVPEVTADILLRAFEKTFRCYAGMLYLRFAEDPLNSEWWTNPCCARPFEQPTRFPGRMEEASRWSDLRGRDRDDAPWLNGLKRLISVSDMGDALSQEIGFPYLKSEIVDNVASELGSRHLWLWLTKRPGRMAEFSAWHQTEHGLAWPENLVAMTSVTNRDTLNRIDELRAVPAAIRGLSVEPLLEAVSLDLEGIDWVIVGGESGNHARRFDLAWARSLREQCRAAGVAFFVKQLGANPVEGGSPLRLRDDHGGDWSEWPEDLRVREMPAAFRSNRRTA